MIIAIPTDGRAKHQSVRGIFFQRRLQAFTIFPVVNRAWYLQKEFFGNGYESK